MTLKLLSMKYLCKLWLAGCSNPTCKASQGCVLLIRFLIVWGDDVMIALVKWILIHLPYYDCSLCILITLFLIEMLPPINLHLSLESLLGCTCQCVSIFIVTILSNRQPEDWDRFQWSIFVLAMDQKTIPQRQEDFQSFCWETDVQNIGSIGRLVFWWICWTPCMVFLVHDQWWS